MTLQEKIQKKAEGYWQLAPIFLEGAEFVLENQLTKTDRLNYFVQYMYYKGPEWEFSDGGGVSHWMPIPKLPKE